MTQFRTLLIVFFLMAALSGCLDIPERCGMDYEITEYELWSLNLNDFSISEAYQWETRDMYDGYSTSFKIYGISPDESVIYYTDGRTSINTRLHSLDLDSRSTELINTFVDSRDFTLSPSGKLLAFQKESTVWISDISGENPRKLLEPDSLQFFGKPQWYLSDNNLIVAHSRFKSDQGMWLLDVKDSTYSIISDVASTNYDITNDGSGIVLQGSEPLEPPLIQYKQLSSDNLITLHKGTNPLFINNGSHVIFEQLDGLSISDLNGELRKIYDKPPASGSLSRNGRVSVSPNTRTIAYSVSEGLFIYQPEDDEILYSLSPDSFLPENQQNWSSIRIDLFDMTFSPDSALIYFIMKRHFFSDGC